MGRAGRAHTPERCPTGCLPTAGAAILQYYQAAEPLPMTSYACSLNGEDIVLSTKPGAYDWANADDDLYARVAYNLGVQLGVAYTASGTTAAAANLAPVLTYEYGLDAELTQVPSTTGIVGEALEGAVYAPMRLGWPVALAVQAFGETALDTRHAVVAAGYAQDDAGGDWVRVFMGYGGAYDGWFALPDIGDYTAITETIAVRPQGAVGVYGQLFGEDDASLVVTCGGEAHTVRTGAYGQYAFAQAAAGTLAIGPEVVAVDLERTPDFAFVCRQTQADGSLREVVPTWSATLSNGRAVSLTPEGRIVCPTGGFASATLAPAAWGTPTAASRFFRVSVDLE